MCQSVTVGRVSGRREDIGLIDEDGAIVVADMDLVREILPSVRMRCGFSYL
jgi:hypothetical protein